MLTAAPPDCRSSSGACSISETAVAAGDCPDQAPCRRSCPGRPDRSHAIPKISHSSSRFAVLPGRDVFLISASRKFFLAGLIAFLAGHVFYSIAFYTVASPGSSTLFAATACCLLSGAFFLRIRPYLGTMMLPVAAYVAIITIMVIGAATLMGESGLPVGGRALALTGAVFFYLSDLFVARERFVKHEFLNRLVGLPLYYACQFMIAFSTSLL